MRPLALEAFPRLRFRSGKSRFIRRKRLSSATSPASIKTSDANGVGLADPQRNVRALHQNATRHGIPIVVSPAAVHVSNRSASTYRIVRRSTIDDNPPRQMRARLHTGAQRIRVGRAVQAPQEAGIRDIRGNKDPHFALFASPPSSDRCDPSPEAPSSTDFPTPYFVEGPTHDAANASSIFTTSRSALEIAVPEVIVKRARQTDFLRARQPNAPPIPEKRNKEEIRPPIVDRAIVSSFSISFLM